MGRLTTHILDATHGTPAAAVKIRLFRLEGEARSFIKETQTNEDGRTDAPMLEADMSAGVYELEFHIGDYFRAKLSLPATPFLDVVPIRFGIDDADAHYHVPLLASPFSYSTYRGS